MRKWYKDIEPSVKGIEIDPRRLAFFQTLLASDQILTESFDYTDNPRVNTFSISS